MSATTLHLTTTIAAMILRNLSAWITNARGEQIEEFERIEVSENKVECWIPCVEGDSFVINWQPTRDFEPGLGLECLPKLDGNRVSSNVLGKKEIARGVVGKKNGMSISPTRRRLFVFGSRELTDSDEVASPHNPMPDLGTIHLTLTWVSGKKIPRRRTVFGRPPETGPIHERAAKKGHTTAASLGDIVQGTRRNHWRTTDYVNAGITPAVFVFKYAPRGKLHTIPQSCHIKVNHTLDWLKAREIIPEPASQQSIPRKTSPTFKRKRSPSLAPSALKRLRTADPSEIIDVDELETDSDSDVVVLNDPIEPDQTKPVKTES